MDMDMGTPTSTAAAATATSEAASMDMDTVCKIDMLWNWTTIDSCFISRSWHITSTGMFIGSCFAVVFLVVALEALRRGAREFDRFLVRQARAVKNCPGASSEYDKNDTNEARCGPPTKPTRPNLWQQLVRALLHCAQFTVAYFIMLLAMYFNGYIIISIIVGAFLGSFICSWEAISLGSDDKREATLCCG
ncbi:Ctr copper transporter family-domain-containing protein [Calycina marina]|uniref:Copper transport protein n=1 Tax=Calycina marina TaxID=1763456 RepID=A0A9P7Z3L1_9HELO|nr:Ctr copper transporter family-domain-containing protein [Calycina marina]